MLTPIIIIEYMLFEIINLTDYYRFLINNIIFDASRVDISVRFVEFVQYKIYNDICSYIYINTYISQKTNICIVNDK